METRTSSGLALVERLRQAVNGHDLDALADCFAEDFANETPVHPARSFRGREQVRENWGQIFAGVPDIEAEVVSAAMHGTSAWTEWEMRGTRRGGVPHLMRGVSIFTIGGDEFTSVHFYQEPVDDSRATVGEAVRTAVGR